MFYDSIFNVYCVCLFQRTEAGETPLQLAIHCRLGLVVEALCVRGVDMSRLDANGVPPLWAALDSGQEEVASVSSRKPLNKCVHTISDTETKHMKKLHHYHYEC